MASNLRLTLHRQPTYIEIAEEIVNPLYRLDMRTPVRKLERFLTEARAREYVHLAGADCIAYTGCSSDRGLSVKTNGRQAGA